MTLPPTGPGSEAPTLAVIGGGQLARMMAQPAIALGLPLRLLAEAEGVSAAQVIPDSIVGDYRDLEMLRKVTAGAQVVTFDHEHVPTEHLHALEEAGIAVRPGPDALVHAQDKAVMRRRLAELDVPCPRNVVVTTTAEVEAFGLPCVLKTTRGGYDGKGVWVVRALDEAQVAFDAAAAPRAAPWRCASRSCPGRGPAPRAPAGRRDRRTRARAGARSARARGRT